MSTDIFDDGYEAPQPNFFASLWQERIQPLIARTLRREPSDMEECSYLAARLDYEGDNE